MMVLDEEQAEQVPKAYEPWLVTDEESDLYGVLEEELLLNLPLIASHDFDCIDRSKLGSGPAVAESESTKRSPFDVLKQLKTDKK